MYRADLNSANALGTDCIFPTLDPSDIGIGERQDGLHININENSADKSLDVDQLSQELKENFTNLKYLAKLNKEDDGYHRGEKIQQIRDSDMLYFTERSLQRLSNIWGPQKFVTSGCMAAIIFLDNYLRGIQLNSRMMDRLVARLHHSMKLVFGEMAQHDGREKASKAIFWVLFVGGVASGIRSEREWFLAHLIDFSDWLAIQSWEEAERILKDFLWPTTWDRLGHFLWNQIDDTRLVNMIDWPDATSQGGFDVPFCE